MSKLESHRGLRKVQEAAADGLMLMFNMTITAPALFCTLPQIWQKIQLPTHIFLNCGLMKGPIIATHCRLESTWIKHWAWGCCASGSAVLILTELQISGASPALHSPRCVRGGRLQAPLSPSAVLAAQKTSCKSSCYICFHTGFSLAITGSTFATKWNKPKYVFSFKIP